MITLPVLYAVICSVLWAASTVIAKLLAASNTPALILAFLRYAIAVVCLFPFISSVEYRNITMRQLPLLMILGLTGVLLFNGLFFAALNYTSATTVSLILATHPILTLVISSIFFSRMPNTYQVMAFMLSFGGVAMVVTQGTFQQFGFVGNLGELLMFAAVLSQVVYTMTLKQVSASFSPHFLAFATGVSGLLFLLVPVFNQNILDVITALDLSHWMLLGLIGVFGTALAVVCYSKAIRAIGPAMTSLLVFSTMPIFVFLLSFFVLGDTISLWQAGGGFMIVLALLIGLNAV